MQILGGFSSDVQINWSNEFVMLGKMMLGRMISHVVNPCIPHCSELLLSFPVLEPPESSVSTLIWPTNWSCTRRPGFHAFSTRVVLIRTCKNFASQKFKFSLLADTGWSRLVAAHVAARAEGVPSVRASVEFKDRGRHQC